MYLNGNFASMTSRCEVVIKTKPAKAEDLSNARMVPVSTNQSAAIKVVDMVDGINKREQRSKESTIDVTSENPLYSYLNTDNSPKVDKNDILIHSKIQNK